MRVWTIPAVIAGALIGAPGLLPPSEPSERDMRAAFEGVLSMQVRNALEFAAESGGDETLAKIRENGTDRFVVLGFRKLKCEPQASGHRCDFQVDLELSNGRFERTLSGSFVTRADGMHYAEDI